MEKDNNLELMDEGVLTISEMANICRVSRQTLIYYDKNDIFKPIHTGENGYRIYSIHQIPFLREICALKEKNLLLKDIVDNLNNRKVETVMDLLALHEKKLDEEIAALFEKKNAIDERMDYYRKAEIEMARVEQPYIKAFPHRKLMYEAWGTEDMNRGNLHRTHMNLRNRAKEMEITVDFGWGAFLFDEDIKSGSPIRNAGGYVVLPKHFDMSRSLPVGKFLEAPEGFYACMNVYAMPYDTTCLKKLYDWIDEHHYKVNGDLLNECILDATFYTKDQKSDFCQLQVPVILPGTE